MQKPIIRKEVGLNFLEILISAHINKARSDE